MSDGTVYLLHFAEPIGDLSNPHGSAQHYMGWSGRPYLGARLGAHRDGVGAAIMKAVAEAGIDFTVARTWEGNRGLERSLKNRHDHPGLCPVCCGQERRLDPRTRLVDVGQDVERWVELRRRDLAAEHEASYIRAPDRAESAATVPEAVMTVSPATPEQEHDQGRWPAPAASWAGPSTTELERGWER